MSENNLVNYDEFIFGMVLHRPSKIIKSPYMTDVIIDGENVLCHSPSLGCNGIIDRGIKVVCIKNKNMKAKSKYKIIGAYNKNNDNYIGTDPNISNNIVFDMIKNNKIPNLEDLTFIKQEHKVSSHTRLDIYGEKDNLKYYIEIKTAPVKDEETSLAIFPKGFRKKKSDPFSPAIKHIETLIELEKWIWK